MTVLETAAYLKELDGVLILTHVRPDGDTVGSAGALYHALRALGKQVAVACSDAIPARYAYMQLGLFGGEFEPDYIVAVDVAGLQLFGAGTIAWAERCDLCIDHHASHSHYADGLVLDGSAAACAEIMYRLLQEMGVEITPLICSPRKQFDLAAVQKTSSQIHEYIRTARRIQLGRIGPEDPGSPIRVLGELDIINAYERIRAYYLNCAETLAGGKR